MKRLLLLACALAAVLTPAALALPGSVGVTTTGNATTCNGATSVTVSLQAVAPPPEDAPLDLVIAIDDSGSLSNADFLLERNAARDFVNALDFTGGVRKVGVLKFADFGETVISLSNNKASVTAAINAITHEGGFTNITDAIRDARTMLTGAGSQPGAAKVLLLITDGENNREVDQLNTQVAQFKAMPDGEIFALGFGTADVAQLNFIASDPDSTHVNITPNASELSAIAADIAQQIQAPAASSVLLTYQVAAATFLPTALPTVTTGTMTPLGGHVFRWAIPTLDTGTQTLTVPLAHVGSADGAFPAFAAFSLSYLDGDGNPQTQSPTSPAVTVTGCNEAPTADAGADQAIPLSGSPTAMVTMNGSGSSDPDGDPLEYAWSQGATPLGTGATPSMPLGLGTHTITLTVTDPAGLSDTDEVTIAVTDPSPPSITANVAGTLGDNGWYTSDVGVSWTVVDAESPATTSGCDPSSVTADTLGASFTCSATSAGGSASETVTVKRDATDPAIAFAGNAGTYGVTDTIAITCSASDAMSGLASSTCPGASGPATDFLGAHTLNASATDNAGNTASATTSFTVAVRAGDLCELTEQYVGHHGVAHALCVKLDHGSIRAYVNQVNAQRGLRLTNAEADLLIHLAGLL